MKIFCSFSCLGGHWFSFSSGDSFLLVETCVGKAGGNLLYVLEVYFDILHADVRVRFFGLIDSYNPERKPVRVKVRNGGNNSKLIKVVFCRQASC